MPVIAQSIGNTESARTVIDGKTTLDVPGCGPVLVNAGDKLHAMAKAETTPLIKDRLYSQLSITEDDVLAQRAQIDKLVDSTSSRRYYPGIGASSNDPALIGKIKLYAEAHITRSSRRAADTVDIE